MNKIESKLKNLNKSKKSWQSNKIHLSSDQATSLQRIEIERNFLILVKI